MVNAPDQPGRRQILAVHTRGVPLDPAVSLETLASGTPGMVGADLKNLVNEAALLAARRNHTRVGVDDFSDAVERIILGTARRLLLAPDEKVSYGRPVGVTLGPDGSLLVADDVGTVIWRVTGA